jgi:hypothetical protein
MASHKLGWPARQVAQYSILFALIGDLEGATVMSALGILPLVYLVEVVLVAIIAKVRGRSITRTLVLAVIFLPVVILPYLGLANKLRALSIIGLVAFAVVVFMGRRKELAAIESVAIVKKDEPRLAVAPQVRRTQELKLRKTPTGPSAAKSE